MKIHTEITHRLAVWSDNDNCLMIDMDEDGDMRITGETGEELFICENDFEEFFKLVDAFKKGLNKIGSFK